MYYWVNQGKTYKEEKEGGYLWAPIKNSQGNSFFHWNNMKLLNPDDIVFNYRKGYLVSYCIVESKCYFSTKPEEFNVDVEWEEEGYMVDVRYFMFRNKIDLETIYETVKDSLPEKYSPINKSNEKVKANQGYLYQLNQETGSRIIKLSKVSYYINDSDNLYSFKEDEESYRIPDSTSRKGLVISRVGQGEYRRRILKRWNYKCAVTRLDIKEILIASHIVPWREATDKERLDIHNGLLLSPTFDALFDRNLISFDDEGKIILSPAISKDQYIKMGITGNEKIEGLTKKNKHYLKRHRDLLTRL